METFSRYDDCTFDGRTYSHGEQMCGSDRCMRCDDGDWEERLEDLMYGIGP